MAQSLAQKMLTECMHRCIIKTGSLTCKHHGGVTGLCSLKCRRLRLPASGERHNWAIEPKEILMFGLRVIDGVLKDGTGTLNSMIKILMDQLEVRDPVEAIRLINSKEAFVTRVRTPWSMCDSRFVNDVNFSVTSYGKLGGDWFQQIKGSGAQIDGQTEEVLRSYHFKPTSGVRYDITVQGVDVFDGNWRVQRDMKGSAEREGLLPALPEISCLMWERFTREEIRKMGYRWIIVQHEPIKIGTGEHRLLKVSSDDEGRQTLSTTFVREEKEVNRLRHGGLAYVKKMKKLR